MIPFEALHPQEALFLQYIYSKGWFVTQNWRIAIRVKLHKRHLTKYTRKIRWIRSLQGEIEVSRLNNS